MAFTVTTLSTPVGRELGDRCEGAVDNVRELARLTCKGGLLGDFETVTIDDTTYTRDPGSDGKWSSVPADGEDPHDEFSPAEILELLRSASRKTERVGEEDVRGEPTVQYALTVDCEQAELTDCPGSTAVVDVWIDGDGLVRRIRVNETDLAVEIEFFDFGTKVEVEAPPADLVELEEWLPPVVTEPVPEPCRDGSAKPIAVDEAVGALRRNGFRASVHEGSCSGLIAAEISAELGPDVTASCYVLTPPDRGTAFGTSQLGGPPEAGTRAVANVHCTLRADDEETDDALEALDRALAELKQQLPPE